MTRVSHVTLYPLQLWFHPEISGIGAGIDSFYEYALKWYIMSGTSVACQRTTWIAHERALQGRLSFWTYGKSHMLLLCDTPDRQTGIGYGISLTVFT